MGNFNQTINFGPKLHLHGVNQYYIRAKFLKFLLKIKENFEEWATFFTPKPCNLTGQSEIWIC